MSVLTWPIRCVQHSCLNREITSLHTYSDFHLSVANADHPLKPPSTFVGVGRWGHHHFGFSSRPWSFVHFVICVHSDETPFLCVCCFVGTTVCFIYCHNTCFRDWFVRFLWHCVNCVNCIGCLAPGACPCYLWIAGAEESCFIHLGIITVHISNLRIGSFNKIWVKLLRNYVRDLEGRLLFC